MTLTFSDLNDARIPLRKELTFSATLVVGRFRGFGAEPPGLGAVSGFDLGAGVKIKIYRPQR